MKNNNVTIMPMYGCPIASFEPDEMDEKESLEFLKTMQENNTKSISKRELKRLMKTYKKLSK